MKKNTLILVLLIFFTIPVISQEYYMNVFQKRGVIMSFSTDETDSVTFTIDRKDKVVADDEDTSEKLLTLYDNGGIKQNISTEIDGTEYQIEELLTFFKALYVPEDFLRIVFRIPSGCVTNKGTLLVACENRHNGDDKNEIDILVNRREDNGKSSVISRVFENNETGRCMNPIFVVDRIGATGTPGRVYLFTCRLLGGYAESNTTNQTDFVLKYSDDDGKTWSDEISLKQQWNLYEYTAVIPSCCNAIQKEDGTILVPTMVIKDNQYHSGILYKKNKGDWIFSSPTPNLDNECTVFVDSNNNICLDCRTREGVRRRYHYKMNSDKWDLIKEYPVNVNFKSEISKIIIEGKEVMLMPFLDTDTNIRENITLYASFDGYNWKKIYRVHYCPVKFRRTSIN